MPHVTLKPPWKTGYRQVGGWYRYNSFLTHRPHGDFCPGVYRSIAGVPSRPRPGRGLQYRITANGPGVTPDPVAADPVRPGNSDLCFHWHGEIEDAVEHLRSVGVPVELGPVERHGAQGGGASVYFRDPDGSLLEFISYSG